MFYDARCGLMRFYQVIPLLHEKDIYKWIALCIAYTEIRFWRDKTPRSF